MPTVLMNAPRRAASFPALSRWAALAAVLLVMSCVPGERSRVEPAKYLYVWAGDEDAREGDSDFLAVIDVDSISATYGEVIATVPIGAVHTMPHHAEMVMPRRGRPLFANAFMTGRTYLFNMENPRAPAIERVVDSVPGFRKPHSYWRLRNGRVLATMQFGDGSRAGDPGGLALFSPDGDVERTASSADPAFAGAAIRTYSLDVSEKLDRIITTSSPMDTEHPADVLQVWRLKDLALLATVPVPDAPSDSADQYPFEVRFLGDGNAFFNTWNCGFYLLSGITGGAPSVERILALDHPRNVGCGVPTLKEHFWIMPIAGARQYMVLDIADPRRPRIASVLASDSAFFPHWTSVDPGSDRIAMTSEGPDHRVRLARLDSISGLLTWDMSFGRNGAGVSFSRDTWPHGASGPAIPHAAVFGPGSR